VQKLLKRRLDGKSFVEGHEALVDTFLLEHKKGFPFSPDIAIQIGFDKNLVTKAVEEASQRLKRGETLEDYQSERRREFEGKVDWSYFVSKDWRPAE
jgi:hypothetical protein